ncbi:MAG: biotin--[acetyl-CoA-carboxylase] ligase [Actinomycetota bacterium]|nr:biotin--[acetyl-CoA-carboxylase] ligase [Actinomycetota bacterium]
MSSKEGLLTILKKADGGFVSGQSISAALNVSRTAVWKGVQSLKEDGYSIEAAPGVGYRLLSVTEKLLASEIGPRPPESFGHVVHHFDKIASTNLAAKRYALDGAAHGTLIVAETQTGGKGRLGRTWHSPEGGIWISLIARPKISVNEAAKFTPMTTLAVALAIGKAAGLEAMVKWPNDILVNGRKVAGILTEMGAELERVSFLVIGIGINVNLSASYLPSELEGKATTLMDEMGAKVDRARLLRAILDEIDLTYARFLKGEYLAILDELKAVSATLGQTVTAVSGSKKVSGQALGFDELGGLLIGLSNGTIETVYSGEII